jgi:hypothetical protein
VIAASAGTMPRHDSGDSVPLSRLHMRFVGLLFTIQKGGQSRGTLLCTRSGANLYEYPPCPSTGRKWLEPTMGLHGKRKRSLTLPGVVGRVVADDEQPQPPLRAVLARARPLEAIVTDGVPALLPLSRRRRRLLVRTRLGSLGHAFALRS